MLQNERKQRLETIRNISLRDQNMLTHRVSESECQPFVKRRSFAEAFFRIKITHKIFAAKYSGPY